MIGDMEKGWSIVRQRDFTGGESQASLPELIGTNQFSVMENVMVSPGGYITESHQTDRTAIHSETGLDLKGVVLRQMPSTTQYNYWHTSGGLINTIYTGYYNPSSDPVNTDDNTGHYCEGCDIKGLSMAIEFLGKHYCINATGGILNLSDYQLIQNGNLITKNLVKLASYMNILWGITTDGEIVYSGNGDASTWDYLNIIRLPAWERAIDFKVVQGGVIVYSRSSVYAMYGSDYTDISLTRLKEGVMLSDGAVELDNVVYVCGNRGIYAITLNGIEEKPHHQEEYFSSNYRAWTANETGNVQGIYLHRQHAILYLFRSDVGSKGFIYYIKNGSFSKINASLSVHAPYMLPLEHGSVSYLIYSNASTICAGTTPVTTLNSVRTSTIRTPDRDMGTSRFKVIREIGIRTSQIVSSVDINIYLDGSETPHTVCYDTTLSAGDNHFWISPPRFRTISIEIIINTKTAFTFQEFWVRFREAGSSI